MCNMLTEELGKNWLVLSNHSKVFPNLRSFCRVQNSKNKMVKGNVNLIFHYMKWDPDTIGSKGNYSKRRIENGRSSCCGRRSTDWERRSLSVLGSTRPEATHKLYHIVVDKMQKFNNYSPLKL